MQVALSFIALPHPTPYIRAQMNLIDIENGYRTRQHGFASTATKNRYHSLEEISQQSSLYCLVVDFVGHLNSIPRLSDECYCVILLLCETGSLYKKFFPADLV